MSKNIKHIPASELRLGDKVGTADSSITQILRVDSEHIALTIETAHGPAFATVRKEQMMRLVTSV